MAKRSAKQSYKPKKSEVVSAVRASGFPFQLEVAAELKDAGWEIEPFKRFYSAERAKDVEIDVVATSWLSHKRQGFDFKGQISIGVECKASDLPYVCLGLDYVKPIGPDHVDPDSWFTHIFTTRQSDRNQWVMPVFNSKRPGVDVKAGHLHFGSGPRFRYIVGSEWRGSGPNRTLKVHSSEDVNYDISRLGWFIEDFHTKFEKLDREFLEQSQKAVVVAFPFTALVLRDPHYRYDTGTRKLATSKHTPVFVNRDTGKSFLNYVVDVVAAKELPTLLAKYEKTASLMLKQTAAWVVANKDKWRIS
ncbi:MAG: hypothetical protein KDB29_12785 [Planctomycetes bacterium]|nr:hypothetical protein [Planctomycetota bacterium]